MFYSYEILLGNAVVFSTENVTGFIIFSRDLGLAINTFLFDLLATANRIPLLIIYNNFFIKQMDYW